MNYDKCLSKTSQADTEGHTFMMIARYLGLGFPSYILNLEEVSCINRINWLFFTHIAHYKIIISKLRPRYKFDQNISQFFSFFFTNFYI